MRSGYLDAARQAVVADLTVDGDPGNRWRAVTAAALRYRDLGLASTTRLPTRCRSSRSAPDFTECEARHTIVSVWR